MIRNHYLFSSQFRNYLHGQQLEDEEFFEGFKETVISFLNNAEQENLDSLTQQVVAPLLAQLQFANAPLESSLSGSPAQYGYLYDGFPLENKVSCVYVVSNPPPGRGQGWVLDRAEKGNFPAFELIHLLKQENLEWGILTNGLVWRLYSTLSSQPYEQYLEIDFPDAQEEEFKVFWQLFSLTLFLPNEHDVTPLETYIEESAKEAEVIEKHIKSNIEEILENTCFGLLSFAGKDKQPLSETEKQTYFENAVYLLFRLLFVFYAESRELLPINNPEYQKNSLQALLQQTRDWMQSGVTNPDGTELWDGFRDLCHKIEYGDQSLGIPEYDGGLFDSQLHGFLSDGHNKVKNLYFVNVLYLLGYRTQRKQEQAIDYRDLSVRSLGSLYEGILEYKLFIAEEELVLRKKQIVPVREAGKVKKSERVIPQGHVYFSQAANERHDTGSYYTPEYVVDYMVKNSVRVGLEERWQAFLPTIERYAKELRVAVSEDMRVALLKKLDQELLRFVGEQVLSFKVVDPAMGSGHFLVNSLNTITHFILEVLQVKVSPVISPAISPAINDRSKSVSRLKPASSELSGHQGASASLNSEPGVLTPGFSHHNPAIDLTPAVWRRKVVERCIFGVDINPLATELAKLSLWIASADAGKPLTFLNHHLKWGDSILGIRLEDMLTYPEKKSTTNSSFRQAQDTAQEEGKEKQTTIWDVIDKKQISSIKEQFQRFLNRDSDQMEQILSKKDTYEEIKQNPILNHLKDMATLWLLISLDANSKKNRDLFDTAPQFPDETQYFKLLEETQNVQTESEWEKIVGQQVYAAIKEYQQAHRLCHWELEFPEIMDEGFDAVISNPPYIRQEKLGTQKMVLQYLYPDTYSGSGDIYIYFFDRGFQLLKEDCLLCFIASNKWTRAKYGEPFRRFILDRTSITRYLDFSDLPVFGKVTVATSVIVLQKNTKQADFQLCKFGVDFQEANNFNRYINRHTINYSHSAFELGAFAFANPTETKLKQKMEEIGSPLKKWDISINAGIKTGYNEAFIITKAIRDELIAKDSKNSDIIKSLLRGRDIKRYSYRFNDLWLINAHNGIKDRNVPSINIKKDYPIIFDYLKQYEIPLRKRLDQGEHWTNLRNCAYLEKFEKEKLVWIELSDKANFSLDCVGHYTLNTTYMITGKCLKYLLACLNSKLSEWYFYQISTSSGAGTTRWIKYKIEQLLIPNISEAEQRPFINLVDQIIAKKKNSEDTTTLEQQIDRMVYALYGLTGEEIAMVEGRKS